MFWDSWCQGSCLTYFYSLERWLLRVCHVSSPCFGATVQIWQGRESRNLETWPRDLQTCFCQKILCSNKIFLGNPKCEIKNSPPGQVAEQTTETVNEHWTLGHTLMSVPMPWNGPWGSLKLPEVWKPSSKNYWSRSTMVLFLTQKWTVEAQFGKANW